MHTQSWFAVTDDHIAMLEVHDTGIGISQADLRRVFERFYRADVGRGRDAGGTGLGLSIARWIADQHGADLRLSSEQGRGTRVLVRFPLSKPQRIRKHLPDVYVRQLFYGRAPAKLLERWRATRGTTHDGHGHLVVARRAGGLQDLSPQRGEGPR